MNPTPYRAGATSYGSPFDNLYPWSGMVRVTDAVAGELVAIPKFWYKWTKSGNSLKLQIADKETDGFHVSPPTPTEGGTARESGTLCTLAAITATPTTTRASPV